MAWPNVPSTTIVDTPQKAESMCRLLFASKEVGVDTECGGVDISKHHPKDLMRVYSVQFAAIDQDIPKTFFVPAWGKHRRMLACIKPYLESDKKQKVLHNAKFDMHVLANHGIKMCGLLGDTMVMDFLYDTSQMSHALKECMRRYFDSDTAVDYKDEFKVPVLKKNGVASKRTRTASLDEILSSSHTLRKLITYAGKDPIFTVQLYRYLRERLASTPWAKDRTYLEYYEEFELPFTEVLFDMERRGSLLDSGLLDQLNTQVTADLAKVERSFARSCVKAGIPQSFVLNFNMGSSQQVGRLLEQHLGVFIQSRTPTGKPATDDRSLCKMHLRAEAREIVSALLEQRRLKKFLTTYIHPFQEALTMYGGRLHTNYKQIGTMTMRLSSSCPNLQNIPGAGKDRYGIRKAFVAPPGAVIGDIDLSQIEMRLMAHITSDPVMLRAIRDGWDMHSLTATEIDRSVKEWVGSREMTADLLKEIKANFPEARQRAKVINFGVGYGMGGGKYADMAGVGEREGYEAIDRFFRLYSGLKRGIKQAQKECYEHGYVRTILRRYLRIPGIKSDVPGIRKAAERQAFNYKVQGSAADLLKMSMILIERDAKLRDLGVKMTMQIHDELVFEIPKGVEKEVAPIIEEYVSHPYKVMGMRDLKVDTPAEIGFGNSWGEAKT